MHVDDLHKFWESIFYKLGYRETEYNNWVYETQELIIFLSFRVDKKKYDIYIEIGIIIKKWYRSRSLKEPVIEDLDIGQGLYNILYYMGEWEYYLNNLFSYDPEINSDTEIKENSREIARLFITKVIPYIEQLDTYAWMAEDFEKVTTWEPFLQYFQPGSETDEYFDGALEKYYLLHWNLRT